MKRVYIFVEGNTDRAVIEALLLKRLKYRSYEKLEDMPESLKRQVPRYPKATGELEMKGRPLFLYKQDVCVMIEITGGKEKIADNLAGRLLGENLNRLETDDPLSIVVIRDRDFDNDNLAIKTEFKKDLLEKEIVLQDDNTVTYKGVHCAFHMYVLPVRQEGAIESILLDLATVIYPELTEEAHKFRIAIESKEEYEHYRTAWASSKDVQRLYAEKVQIGAISSVLKPDSSPGLMIRDNLICSNNIEII